jgi:hypothetical protein
MLVKLSQGLISQEKLVHEGHVVQFTFFQLATDGITGYEAGEELLLGPWLLNALQGLDHLAILGDNIHRSPPSANCVIHAPLVESPPFWARTSTPSHCNGSPWQAGVSLGWQSGQVK